MHKIAKQLLVSAAVIGLACTGLFTAGNSALVHANEDSRMAPVNNQTNIKYTKPRENYWANRVKVYANVREPFYHSDITYNTRSLGRLPTANYKYAIRQDRIFRSANLHYINAKAAKRIKQCHINSDIDLRAWSGPNNSIKAKTQPGESKSMPDRYRMHIRYHNYPVENSKEEAMSWPYRKKYGEGYRFSYWYALSNTAKRAYHNAFLQLLRHKKGATVINCTQGRDRTGTMCILLENALGMSQYNIYNDFLLTNYYRWQSSYINQLVRIDTFYDSIKKDYGSIDRYIRYGLNITPRQLRDLRNKYLMRISYHSVRHLY